MNAADIVYLEVDAEITEAIDKLKSAKSATVKLVVPARSSLLQSAVNLKLLKKAAKDHGKEIALVTGDKTATYLAAGVGLAVASTLKAEPKIPAGVAEDIEPDIVEQASSSKLDSNKGSSGSKRDNSDKSPTKGNDEDAVVTRRDIGEGLAAGDALGEAKDKAKVPNYNKFQKKLMIGAGIVVAIILLVIAAIVLPTAKLTVLAKADKLAVNSAFIVDSTATGNDKASLTFVAKKLATQKDLTSNFTATGKKDIGTKATGNVSVSNCSNSDDFTIAAGTILTSGGKTFTLNAATLVPGAKFAAGICTKPGAASGSITATANGDAYNLGGASFSISGYDPKVFAKGSTSGGTSKTVTIVTQSDIDGGKQQAIDAAADKSKDELLAKVDKTDQVFDQTYVTKEDSTTSTAPVGSENNNGTVTIKVTYSVFTTTQKTVDELLNTLAKDALPKGDQQLYQNGRADAKYTIVKAISDTRIQLNVDTTAYYGQKIDIGQIAKDAASKSKKNVTSIVQNGNPAISGTQIETAPSLMPNMPVLSSHIRVLIKVSTQ